MTRHTRSVPQAQDPPSQCYSKKGPVPTATPFCIVQGVSIVFSSNPYLRICLSILNKEEGRGREVGKGRKREGERGGRERNIDCLPPVHTLMWDRTHNLGMRPDRGSNPQPLWCTE